MATSVPAAGKMGSESSLRVLMIGPVPRVYGGISAVVGMLLDSDLPKRCRLSYLAEGTRQGPAAKLGRFADALVRSSWLLLSRSTDVLHLHVGDGVSFYRHTLYLALGRLARVPVVFHWHLPGDDSAVTRFYAAGGAVRRWLIRRVLSSAQRVVVLSPSWQPALAQIAPPSGRRIAVLANPVDCAAILPPVDPTARSANHVLFLGDFSERKGVRDLLAAAPAVKAHHAAVQFAVCGGDPPADVKVLAEPLGDSVEFPGFVRGQEKRNRLQQAVLLVLPSYAEGLPIAVLEGMAAGLPVVTTPVGGVPDIFEDGINGLLVPPGDPARLAQAICRLLDDPDLRTAMGQANRSKVLTGFDLPIYVEKLLTIYREAAVDA